MSIFSDAPKKIGKSVAAGYKTIESGLTSGMKKVGGGATASFKKIEDKVATMASQISKTKGKKD